MKTLAGKLDFAGESGACAVAQTSLSAGAPTILVGGLSQGQF